MATAGNINVKIKVDPGPFIKAMKDLQHAVARASASNTTTAERFVAGLAGVPPVRHNPPKILQQNATRPATIFLFNSGKYISWNTPHGRFRARIYEMYIGLAGQWRIGLVDQQGRVWHYDLIKLLTYSYG